MHLFLPLVTISLFYSSLVFSQSPALDTYNKAVFFEIGGLGPVYSFDFEGLIRRNFNLTYNYRIGVSLLPDAIAVPVGINVFDTFGDHHFQMNVGLTPYVKKYRTLSIKGSETLLYAGGGIGYRYQKQDGKWFWGVGVNPMVRLDPSLSEIIGPDPRFILSGNLAAGFRW
ncbi:MAG: hypothetical protein SF052_09665 [Bacteroidia bacterium]|nr:hypothetical protein [Bacteroidia bacterium]